MEFNEKLQELRKQKGLTQEELAEILFVSRTAISKWESGRGYPSIESLKAIAKYFHVTVDELLSGEELLTIAGEDNKNKEKKLRDTVFGLLDVSVLLLLFLPLFGQLKNGTVQAVSLMWLDMTIPLLKTLYFAAVSASAAVGILTLALQNWECDIWQKIKSKLSFVFSIFGVLLFIISPQPYAASFLLVFLILKALMLIKW